MAIKKMNLTSLMLLSTCCTLAISENLLSAVVNEGYDGLDLTCARGQKLHIVRAVWGNAGNWTSLRYTGYNSPVCEEFSRSTLTAQMECNGKRLCVLMPRSEIFGEPCPEIEKNLKVQYTCRGQITRPDEIEDTTTGLGAVRARRAVSTCPPCAPDSYKYDKSSMPTGLIVLIILVIILIVAHLIVAIIVIRWLMTRWKKGRGDGRDQTPGELALQTATENRRRSMVQGPAASNQAPPQGRPQRQAKTEAPKPARPGSEHGRAVFVDHKAAARAIATGASHKIEAPKPGMEHRYSLVIPLDDQRAPRAGQM